MPANTLDNFWNKVNKTNNCWEWQGCVDSDGYGRIQINKIRWKTHRLSYELHKGNIPKHLVVCHSCDNPKCVNPDHLWLGTQTENTQDRDQKGRHRVNPALGESNGSARFTNEQIEFIRTSPLSGRELSRQFGVSDNAIYNIRL